MISATKEYSQREFGIDILRVIAMLLIVMHHILSHGNLYESAIQSGGVLSISRLAIYAALESIFLQ